METFSELDFFFLCHYAFHITQNNILPLIDWFPN